jgi:N-acetyl-1-D-myo-inositol-2-amino-2-deoxy-alpha-D-glucopyranoside deacetylase
VRRSGRRLLLVHAHPDDEALWTGGTIARYAASGVHITLVTCTLGEEGEVIPAALRGLAADAADQLGGYRVGELRAACAALGINDQRFLGGIGRWRDSGMAGTPANAHPRAFAGGALDEQVAALSETLAEVRPQVVVTYDENGGYGHPDHIRAHQVTTAAVAGHAFDLHGLYWTVVTRSMFREGLAALRAVAGLPFALPVEEELPGPPDEAVTTTIDVSAQLPAKIAAIRAHATQVALWEPTDWGGADGSPAWVFTLSNGLGYPVPTTERFILAGGRADLGHVANDLFGGLAPDADPSA